MRKKEGKEEIMMMVNRAEGVVNEAKVSFATAVKGSLKAEFSN